MVENQSIRQYKTIKMSTLNSPKKEYSSPELEIIQLNKEGVLVCLSGEKQDYNDGGTMNWGE